MKNIINSEKHIEKESDKANSNEQVITTSGRSKGYPRKLHRIGVSGNLLK